MDFVGGGGGGAKVNRFERSGGVSEAWVFVWEPPHDTPYFLFAVLESEKKQHNLFVCAEVGDCKFSLSLAFEQWGEAATGSDDEVNQGPPSRISGHVVDSCFNFSFFDFVKEIGFFFF